MAVGTTPPQHEGGSGAVYILSVLDAERVEMDTITCSAAISACVKGGQWQQALHFIGMGTVTCERCVQRLRRHQLQRCDQRVRRVASGSWRYGSSARWGGRLWVWYRNLQRWAQRLLEGRPVAAGDIRMC